MASSPNAPFKSGDPKNSDSIVVPARLSLFGHPVVEVDMEVIPRSVRWRIRRTATTLGIFAVITPIVALPPHLPWAAGVIIGATILGRNRWIERFTIVSFEAPCPRCESILKVKNGSRLKIPHPISCEGCNHEPLLTADLPETMGETPTTS